LKGEVRSKGWFYSKRETITCSICSRKRRGGIRTRGVWGKGLESHWYSNLEEGSKKYRAGNRKEGRRNNIHRETEKSSWLESREAFKSQTGPLA